MTTRVLFSVAGTPRELWDYFVNRGMKALAQSPNNLLCYVLILSGTVPDSWVCLFAYVQAPHYFSGFLSLL